MKKIEIFHIQSENYLKDDELLLLRGGYDDDYCGIDCGSDQECGGKCPKCHETAGGHPAPVCMPT